MACRAQLAPLLRGLDFASAIEKAVPEEWAADKDPSDADVGAVVASAAGEITRLIKEALRARKDHAALRCGSPPLQGQSVDVFYGGITSLVGEPLITDIEQGAWKEHHSDERFTTMNNGITTTPQLEFDFVTEFQGPGGDGRVAAGTRRCSHEGVAQADKRTIRPISSYLSSTIVEKCGLTRIEVVSIVLFSGPMFALYNGVLRQSGFCGEVDEGVDFWSKDGKFEKQVKARTVVDRMRAAGHAFSSTLHIQSSAVKKLCSAVDGGMWVYRGLGGLDVEAFVSGGGITEAAFMSTTPNLEVALEYSGAKAGAKGCVFAIQTDSLNHGTAIHEFSQYPSEPEILWNACSYLEPVKGRDQYVMTQWGPVRIVHVRVTSAAKALTIEDLDMRRKTCAINMMNELISDKKRQVEASGGDAAFAKRVEGAIQNLRDLVLGSRPDEFHSDRRFLGALRACVAVGQMGREA